MCLLTCPRLWWGSSLPVHRYLVFASDVSECWSTYGGLVMTYSGVNPVPTGISLSGFTVPENSPAGFTIGTFSMSDVFGDTAASWVVGGGNFALSGRWCGIDVLGGGRWAVGGLWC